MWLLVRQVYKGKDEILLSKLILEPAHSILTQSYDCRLRMVGFSLLAFYVQFSFPSVSLRLFTSNPEIPRIWHLSNVSH